MSNRLRDLDDDLGAAFRSADGDAPRPAAKAALMAALGVGTATLVTATTAAGAATSGAATTAAAGGSTMAVAKSAGMAAVVKWVIASAVVVSGAAATVHAVSPPRLEPTQQADHDLKGATALVAPLQPAPPARPTATAAAAVAAPEELPAAPPEIVAIPASRDELPARRGESTPAVPSATGHASAPPAPAPVVEMGGGETSGPAPLAAPAAPAPPTARTARAADEGAGRPTVGEEIAQLDRARSFLARGRGVEALEAINAYRHAFPAGVLAEEASVLEVESLAIAGQRDRARASGDRFVTSHPRSPLVPRVVRAMGREGQGQAP